MMEVSGLGLQRGKRDIEVGEEVLKVERYGKG